MFLYNEGKRQEIRVAKIQGEYKVMAQLCNKYLNNLLHMDYPMVGQDIHEEMQWSFYNLALATKKMGDVQKAYTLAKKALTYCMFRDINHTYNCLLLGECSFEIGNVQESVEMLDICVIYFDLIGERRYSLYCSFNKAKALNDMLGMEVSIRYYEENEKTKHLNRGDTMLEEMRMELEYRCYAS
ncbi:hypothetical protein LL033_17325 [Clostridium estertheticum]|uniref:hypothetical protein n=1 Tax=Clostridium estertheticum TaxID=238834 RepID=UPI001C0CC41A|nr:hypothetical protein [Clostridium estertheticum]MBU3216669.1 hypothetical protein [Clostridium estertheticum]WAG54375.1 hypothetical protein LL033_17325 [Clostridium estertheticum]